MTAAQFKACVEVARNGAIDLSAYDESALFGFGLPDFKPVLVPLGAVARCIRWQCCQFNGGFDWEQLNEDKPHYLRNVELCDWYTARETEAWKADLVRVLVAGPVGMLETEVSK